MRRDPAFKTEAELCAAFIEWARQQGWIAYAETAGWDVLLVAGDGTQIGVQAKLRFNVHVLSQAVEGKWGWETTGPDFRAVLAPEGNADIASALALTLLTPYRGYPNRWEFRPPLPGLDRSGTMDWHYANPEKRHELPAYVPDVVAGSSAPIQLTKWKVSALKVCALLELHGFVTRGDFRLCGIDYRRWINDNDWLIPGAVPGQFVRGPKLRFAEQHPEVYKQILAEVRKTMPAVMSVAGAT